MTPDKQAAPREWVDRGVELAEEAARWAYKAGDHGNSALLERRDAELAAIRAHLESREAEFQLLEKDITEFREAIAIANERMDRYEALVKQLAEALEAVLEQCGGYVPDTSKAVWAAAFAALAAYQEKT